MARLITLVVALALVALSAIQLWGAAIYSLRGVSASGKVVEFHATSARSRSVEAQVDVTLAGAAPFRWEVEDTFRVQHWEEGASVPLLCAHVHADHWSCVLDSWADRYLLASTVLVAGLGVLWLALRRRPAPGA